MRVYLEGRNVGSTPKPKISEAGSVYVTTWPMKNARKWWKPQSGLSCAAYLSNKEV